MQCKAQPICMRMEPQCDKEARASEPSARCERWPVPRERSHGGEPAASISLKARGLAMYPSPRAAACKPPRRRTCGSNASQPAAPCRSRPVSWRPCATTPCRWTCVCSRRGEGKDPISATCRPENRNHSRGVDGQRGGLAGAGQRVAAGQHGGQSQPGHVKNSKPFRPSGQERILYTTSGQIVYTISFS